MAFARRGLQTDRLLLRPWRLTDVENAYAYGADPEWGRYLWNTPYPDTHEDASAFVTTSVNDAWETEARFAVELDGRAIGGVRLYLTDMSGKVAGMGYNIARAHWGRGYATEAAAAVLAYAFEDAGLHRVYATADSRNVASMRVLEKAGLQARGRAEAAPLASRGLCRRSGVRHARWGMADAGE